MADATFRLGACVFAFARSARGTLSFGRVDPRLSGERMGIGILNACAGCSRSVMWISSERVLR